MSISGTYEGRNRKSELVLRLDVDGATPLNMVSGEIRQPLEFAEYNYFERLEHSFVGHEVGRREDGNAVVFTARLHFFRLPELSGDIEVEVRPTSVVAILHLSGHGYHRQPFSYTLDKVSDHFRSVRLEIDVEQDIEIPTRWRPYADGPQQVPAGFPAEPVTIPTAFERAGIEMIVGDEHTTVPVAGAGADAAWTSAELHAAMVSFFSSLTDELSWNVWFMAASRFEIPGVSGIMFDSAIGAPRQGAAVFWDRFAGLPDGIRQRNFIRTSVHEIGHALNLLHSFQKGAFAQLVGIGTNPFMVPRSDALSFMNYPWRYPFGHNSPAGWNGTPDYWSRFRFEFERIELMHLRHHDRLDVGFGGDPFGGSGHSMTARAEPAEIAEANARSPIELELRGKKVVDQEIRVFELMEPVHLELKVSCKPDAVSATIARHLDPATGSVAVYIQDPAGDVARFQPLMTLCTDQVEERTLKPGIAHYEDVHLTYGKYGFAFATPGSYTIRLVYFGSDGMTAYSNPLQIRVATPKDSTAERAAADFFEPAKGELLALGPCAASHYDADVDDLKQIARSIDGTAASRAIRAYVATTEGLPFRDVTRERTADRVPTVKTRNVKAAPKGSAHEIARLLAPAKDPTESLSNLVGFQLAEARVQMLEPADPKAAKAAAADVRKYVTRTVKDNEELRADIIAGLD